MKICQNAKLSGNEMFNPEMVCFCDIPVGDLNIHIQRYSPFGLSFTKDFVVKHGGSPVYYIPKESYIKIRILASIGDNRGKLFNKLVPKLHAYFNCGHITMQQSSNNDSSDMYIKSLLGNFLDLHVLSYLKFFDHKLPDDHEDNYYSEREWRILGKMKFRIGDVKRILMRESFTSRFREDFPQYCGELTSVDLPRGASFI